MRSPSKAILFVCSKCRHKGDVTRRLFQLESANERANDRCQATEHLLIERQALVEMLQVDKGALQKEIITLKGTIDELRQKVKVAQLIDESLSLPPLLDTQWDKESCEPCSKYPAVEVERTTKVEPETSTTNASQCQRKEATIQARVSQHDEVESLSDSDSSAASNSSSSQTSATVNNKVESQGGGSQVPPMKQQGNVFPYPPGFKQIQERVSRFTGKCGEEDFEVWLADFREAKQLTVSGLTNKGHNGFHGFSLVQPRVHGNVH